MTSFTRGTPIRTWSIARASQRILAGQWPSQRHQHLKAVISDADEYRARAILDLSVRTGELALAIGSTASTATSLARRVAETVGQSVHINVTYDSVTATIHRSLNDDPITSLRVVRGRMVDYGRLSQLMTLVDEYADGEIDIYEARDQFEWILDSPNTYQSWVVYGGSFLLGASVAALLGGSFVEMLLAGMATMLADMLAWWARRRKRSEFTATTLAASVPSIIALLVMVLRGNLFNVLLPISPSLIVAAGMIALLAGFGIVTAARDAIDGNYITAGARTYEVLMMTMAAVLGLLGTLWVGLRIGIPGFIAPTAGFEQNLIYQVPAAGMVAFAFAIGGHVAFRWSLVAGGLGMILWLVYVPMMAFAESIPVATGVAAALVGVVAQIISHRWHFPVVALTSAGIAPLMPGMTLYRGVYQVMENPQDLALAAPGVVLLLTAAFTGLALAIGSSVGTSIARPFPKRPRRRFQR